MRAPASRIHPWVLLPLLLLCLGHVGPPTGGRVARHAIASLRASCEGAERGDFASMRRALLVLLAQDRSAVLRFVDCEVDSFSARPKRRVPDYARATLEALGLDTRAKRPRLMPAPVRRPKPHGDLDDDPTRRLPFENEPPSAPPTVNGEPDDAGAGGPGPVESRDGPPLVLEPRPSRWTPPPPEQVQSESQAALPILAAFLAQHAALFGLDGGAEYTLTQLDFGSGRFFRRLRVSQSLAGRPVIDGDVLALFDTNWNVVGISRAILTPQKLVVAPGETIPAAEAIDLAIETIADLTGRSAEDWTNVDALLGIDPVRALPIWRVRVGAPDPPEQSFTVRVDALAASVLNVSDDALAFTDAKLRRWSYPGGDVETATQVVSDNQFVRDDNTLTHDFFYTATDERGGFVVSSVCTTNRIGAGSPSERDTRWWPGAYGSTGGSSFIRHTHRSDRDFSLWIPSHAEGSFSESHGYFWSRGFFQWLKPSLSELGTLANFSEAKRVLMVMNTCLDDVGKASSSFRATTQHDEGEDAYQIRLLEFCKAGNGACSAGDYQDGFSSHFRTCEGGGCHPSPSLIHHEINHFILARYFGVGSGLDCDVGDERRFLHEGTLGSVVPHAFWHAYYGVGFDPGEDFLFTGDKPRGRVHSNPSNLNSLSAYLCGDNLEGQGPYEAGRVAGQPLWEIYHGRKVEGIVVRRTWRTASDVDFLNLVYEAAQLTATSLRKDRLELANRVMEILHQYTAGSNGAAKRDWCEIWRHHGLGARINPAYCTNLGGIVGFP